MGGLQITAAQQKFCTTNAITNSNKNVSEWNQICTDISMNDAGCPAPVGDNVQLAFLPRMSNDWNCQSPFGLRQREPA